MRRRGGPRLFGDDEPTPAFGPPPPHRHDRARWAAHRGVLALMAMVEGAAGGAGSAGAG